MESIMGNEYLGKLGQLNMMEAPSDMASEYLDKLLPPDLMDKIMENEYLRKVIPPPELIDPIMEHEYVGKALENEYVGKFLALPLLQKALLVVTTGATALVVAFACAFLVWLFLMPDNPRPGDRTRVQIVYLQFRIRLRYLYVSRFGLKPWVSPRISGHVSEDQEHAVDFGYVPKLIMKFIWAVAGFFNGFGPFGAAFSYAIGARFVLEILYFFTHKYILFVCRRLKPEGNTKPLKMEEYDWENGSPEEFYEKYVKKCRPVVLRGIAKQADEISFDNILKKYGEDDVILTRTELKQDYLGKLKEIDDPKIYLANCETVFVKHPEIREQSEIDTFSSWMRKKIGYIKLFVGRNGTNTPLHCASNWNTFTMVDGKKTWYVIDPEHSWFIYPVAAMGRPAIFSMPPFPDEYDENKFPLMKWLPYYKVDIEKGDLLFNPPWWWHAVRNISDKTVGLSSSWHGDGTVGQNGQFTSEDDDVNRWMDWMFFTGPKSVFFMHEILRNPCPMYDEHMTLREKRNRFLFIHNLTQMFRMRF